MRIIFAILFLVIFGLIGAFVAGPVGDWLLLQPKFESPDEAAYFDLVVRLAVTGAVALVGMIIGIIVAGRLRSRLIQREGQ